MEIEAVVSFNRAELYVLLESVSDGNESLLIKISEALAAVESTTPVYGGATRIRVKH